MSHRKAGVLFLLLSCLLFCGTQVVEFPLDGGAEDDAGAEAAPQPGADAGMDAAPQPGTDATIDARADAGIDAGIDVGVDTGIDAGLDAGIDARLDAGIDAGLDTGIDARLDTGSDAIEASLDARVEAAFEAGLAPTVIATTPVDGAFNISINERPTATFSEPMDPATITQSTFLLMQGLTPVSGAVTYDVLTDTATFTPTSPLLVNLPYTAEITTGAQASPALGGLPLAMPYTFGFMTAACSQAPVNLQSAGNFEALAGSTVTNSGPTVVMGDLGVSPGTAVTGFPPGTVTGTQHDGDPAAAQGIADLTTAYNNAAGRTLCPVSEAGDLGGLTLFPGLYKSTTALAITGNLTLDAQGDSDAIFVFQMATTLTVNIGSQIILAGNAKASNIFWQVGSSATLFSNAAFQGTIMADQAITMNTGATLTGRVLARIAGVSLNSNVITTPAP